MRHVLAAKFLDRIEKPLRGGMTPVATTFLRSTDANSMIRVAPRRSLQQQAQSGAQPFLSSRRRQAG